MKLLFVTRKYPPVVGGMELFAYDLSNALAAKTDLTLVKWSGSGRAKAVLVAIPYLSVESFLKLLRGGIDIVHVNDGLLAPTGYVLAKLFRKPFTVAIHGLDITYTNPLFKVLVPWAVRRADTVFCISRAAADEAKKRGVPQNKLQVIPLAVHDDLYGKSDRETLVKALQIPEDSQILLTVGRLVKRKGMAWFVDTVLPRLVKTYPKLVYLVVGEGPERSEIESAARRRGLEKNVLLAGRLDGKLYAAAYNGADVFVMPNIHVPDDVEGFGLVLLEASVCALPVVAADTEGIKDAVADGKNGILVPGENAAAFQKAISRFLEDAAYAKEFGKHARRYSLEHYQWPTIADRYLQQYERLQSGRQTP